MPEQIQNSPVPKEVSDINLSGRLLASRLYEKDAGRDPTPEELEKASEIIYAVRAAVKDSPSLSVIVEGRGTSGFPDGHESVQRRASDGFRVDTKPIYEVGLTETGSFLARFNWEVVDARQVGKGRLIDTYRELLYVDYDGTTWFSDVRIKGEHTASIETEGEVIRESPVLDTPLRPRQEEFAKEVLAHFAK